LPISTIRPPLTATFAVKARQPEPSITFAVLDNQVV